MKSQFPFGKEAIVQPLRGPVFSGFVLKVSWSSWSPRGLEPVKSQEGQVNDGGGE